MTSRLNIVPDERFAALQRALLERLEQVGESITPENFGDLCLGQVHALFEEAFAKTGAHSGLVWILDAAQENLVPAFAWGPAAQRLLLSHRQPLREGIVSLVLMNEQPLIQNDVYQDAKHSKIVDQKFNQRTFAMMAVPFYFLRRCRGVVSAVQLHAQGEPQPPGFQPEHLKVLRRAATLATDLIDYQILRKTVSW
jgi:hypothetical protein